MKDSIEYVCSKCNASVVAAKVLLDKKDKPVCPACKDKEKAGK